MAAVFLFAAATLMAPLSLPPATRKVAQSEMCALDMGSNTFRRITGRFAEGYHVS